MNTMKIISLIIFCILFDCELNSQNKAGINDSTKSFRGSTKTFQKKTHPEANKRVAQVKDYQDTEVYHDEYINPCYRRRTTSSIQIFKVIRSSSETIISGRYTNFYPSGGWCYINRNTIIYDNNTGESYKIIRSEGIPMNPEKRTFTSIDETVDFKFIFPPIPHSTRSFDLLENVEIDEGFNFFEVRLDGVQRPLEFIDFEDASEPQDSIVEPEFPGGPVTLMTFISSNLRYPAYAAEHGIQGRVECIFIVEKDGSVTDIRIKSSPSPYLSIEAIRVFNNHAEMEASNAKRKACTG